MIVGGEGALDTGMLYPFVTEVLAKKFGAAVLEIEHRFYGPYVPVENATSDELLKLLKPAQAMKDMVQLTKHVRDTDFIVCSPDRDSPNYCPIVTVGASYPGFLSFLFRIVHGDFVDISYASSAPLYMYVFFLLLHVQLTLFCPFIHCLTPCYAHSSSTHTLQVC
jgi:hypothetical protein